MKILFITATRIGDAVISTTILQSLKKQYPHAKVTIAVGALSAPLFEDDPYIEKIISVGSKKYNRHWWQMWQGAIGTYWDWIIDLRGSALSYVLLSRKRSIWRGTDQKAPKYIQLSKLLGNGTPSYPALVLSRDRLEKVKTQLKGQGSFGVIAPLANWGPKEWPAPYFIELLRDPQFENHRFLFLCAPHEKSRLKPFLDAFGPKLLTLSPSDHLLDVGAYLGCADFFVGNDSGLMHMAAAMGIPTLGIFGPSNDLYYAPSGPKAHYIRTPETYESLWARVEKGDMDGLMDSLTPVIVAQTLRDKLFI